MVNVDDRWRRRRGVVRPGCLLGFLAVLLVAGVPGPARAAEGDGGPRESDYYEIETFPLPEGLVLEVGGLALDGEGELMVATRRGAVYRVEGAYGDLEQAEFERWVFGLGEPLGLVRHTDGWFYTAQRGELTRMRDADGDGRGDRFRTVSDDWGISGAYHEYAFGPAVGPGGEMWVTLNKPFGGERYGDAAWRGWAVTVDPETGEMTPRCVGLRSPAGVGVGPSGDAFYTDNQGEWCNASKLCHLIPGRFYGHPHGLPDTRREDSPIPPIEKPESGTFMHELHEQIPRWKMPSVWFPYGEMGQSPSGFIWDTSGGEFGPFSGQMFVGDQTESRVMRVDLEKVAGHWQGACFPFRSGFQCGITRLCWGKDQSMFVGQTSRGWGSRGDAPYGLQRLRWTGKVPFEIKTMRARTDGFVLRFTKPVDREAAGKPGTYSMTSYTYRLRSQYGGPEEKVKELKIRSAEVSKDGKRVRLRIEPLRAGFVHELRLEGLESAGGTPLLHTRAYYTLVNIPGGTTLQPEPLPELEIESAEARADR